MDTIDRVIKDFLLCVDKFQSSLLNKPKFHLLLHLPQNMLDYGPTSAYNTEQYIHNAGFHSEYFFGGGGGGGGGGRGLGMGLCVFLAINLSFRS